MLSRFLKDTLIGGFFLLLPVAILALLLKKAVHYGKVITQPATNILENMGVDAVYSPYISTLLALILVCFLLGLIARTMAGKKGKDWLEQKLLMKIPIYVLLKSQLDTQSEFDSDESQKVALALLDGWQIVFITDHLPDDEVVVYVPGAPDPWSGAVLILKKSELRPCSLSKRQAIQVLKRLGAGAAARMYPGVGS